MATGDKIKLGGLYVGGTLQANPTKPWRNDAEVYGGSGVGNIPSFNAGQTVTFGNTPSTDANKIQWVEINEGSKKYLVADRVLLVNISWDDLNALGFITGANITIDGASYKVRSLTGGSNYRTGSDNYSGGAPTTNEWDKWITNESALNGLPTPTASDLDSTLNATDLSSAHNQIWNWFGVYSWAQETYTGNGSSRALRGYNSARIWYYNSSSNRYAGYGFRPVLEVLNSVPVLSGTDTALGNVSSAPTYTYTVNDTDTADTLTVVEKIDGVTTKTITNAVRNQTYSFDFSTFMSLSLSAHTATIAVSDGKGGTTTRTITFTRVDDRIIVRGKTAIETSIASTKIVASGIVTLASKATLKVEACNNGFDASPVWEDITTAYNAKTAHKFANTTKTATKWGVNYRVTVLKNTATSKSYVKAIGISFE